MARAHADADAAALAALAGAVKLVVWDLDDTLWSGTLSEGEVVLDPARAEIVRALNRRGIMSSICSNNDLDAARERLVQEGLWEEFVFPSISWSPKGPRIARIVEDMQLRAPNVLFIDDNVGSLQEALHYLPGLQIAEPSLTKTLLLLPQAKGKDDGSLTRLEHYRVLERKVADRTVADGSNEDFLRTCDIRVELHTECGREAARLTDLINRSNQLNFTKSRTTEEGLTAMFADAGRESGYVRVYDRYGDYGVCGFYSVSDGRLSDYVFSCRILHMGVERWLYERLDRPSLEVVGEVADTVEGGAAVDWITLADGHDAATPTRRRQAGSARVLLKGSCDLGMVASYLGGAIKTELSFPSSTGANVHGDHTEMLRHSREAIAEHAAIIDRIPFLDRAAYGSRIVRSPQTLDTVIFSVVVDYLAGLYRLRGTAFVAPFWRHDIDATDPANWVDVERVMGEVGVDREFLEWFAERFVYEGPIAPEAFKENVRWVAGQLANGTRLVLINGAEIAPHNDPEPGQDLHHQRMNKALDEVVAELPNAEICDVRTFVRAPADLRGDIRHYQREIYLRLAERLAARLDGEVTLQRRGLVMRVRRGRRAIERRLDRAALRFRMR
jgi:FkbH-like protein